MVANSAPSLLARSGRAPEYKACWEELVQVDRLLAEIAELTARKLSRAAVAFSFYKRLT